MEEIFGPEGLYRTINPGFEYRKEQTAMSSYIYEMLVDKRNAMIEAGTGVGKSIAYLVPSLYYCLENGKKLAVSTETKALQKQIIEKEIPAAREILRLDSGCDFSYSLCLGSSNYLCRKRFQHAVKQGMFNGSDLHNVKELTELADSGKVFTRFDVKAGNGFWNNIYRDAEACNGYSCSFYDTCVFYRARREWAKADLLILNHYLFFANIATGKYYLPEIDVMVFDESQSLEDIASRQLGFSVTRKSINDLLGKFSQKLQKGPLLQGPDRESLKKALADTSGKCLTETDKLFQRLSNMFSGDKQYSIIESGVPDGAGLLESLRAFYTVIQEVDPLIDDEYVKIEYDIIRGALFTTMENLDSVFHTLKDDYVYWLEKSETELFGDVSIKGQPVEAASILEEGLSSYESSVYVSATLAVDGDFSFMAERLGITNYGSLLLKSPFNYKDQVVLLINNNIPEPNETTYLNTAAEIVKDIVAILEGKSLVLFTSYKMLNEVKTLVKDSISYPVYAQGDLPAQVVLEKYTADTCSVLMGTHTFWQGIDLPGDLLKGVIMMRLPFLVPDNPPVQAKIRIFLERGRDPFYNYQVPMAILRFKQGFGRLIRGKTDSGIVAVLDSRILTKNYGKLFLKSLPECTIIHSVDQLR